MNDGVMVEVSSAEMLAEYGRVPMRLTVVSRLRALPIDGGLGGIRLVEEPVDPSFVKSYEDLVDTPQSWVSRWDTSGWGFFAARSRGIVVGGAVVVHGTGDLQAFGGANDTAVLWDIRVLPELQRQGVGSRLFSLARQYASDRACRFLKIETQDVNVPACRFYHRQGCYLGGIRRHAYCELPEEVELMWYLPL